MDEIFDSEFCRVQYEESDHVVLLTWKKFCRIDDYRRPTMFASQLLKKYSGCAFVIDARNGFEDDPEDIEWGFHVLLPDMALSGCKKCIFIMEKRSDIEGEIDLWTAEFLKYFQVYKVSDYKEAIAVSR